MDSTKRLGFALICLFGSTIAGVGNQATADSGPDRPNKSDVGKELFTREWMANDKRSFAGDGLGPVFNARSCVACHHNGGTGGSGGRETNATLVSVFVAKAFEGTVITGAISQPDAKEAASMKQPERSKLIEIHPALRTGSSFPMHRFGQEKEFLIWKANILASGRFGSPHSKDQSDLDIHADLLLIPDARSSFRGGMESITKIDGVNLALIQSQRNAPALFGAGLIDGISDRALQNVSDEQARNAKANASGKPRRKPNPRERRSPFLVEERPLPIAGRVLHLKDGRVGRFGWKASVATLKEFTLQACSSELGLEVPGFPRAAPAWKKDYKAHGLDLSAEQCDELVRFVAALPRPMQRPAETPQHAEAIAAGKQLFGQVGCAVCHRPKLDEVDGIYSDLLLHDMGQLLSDSGSYSTNVEVAGTAQNPDPLPVKTQAEERTTKEPPPKFGASTREWRTAPLWGLRDSAPYLHDGRADTISDAVALHGGEGLNSAEAFFDLTLAQRQQLELFLQSLAAPPERQ